VGFLDKPVEMLLDLTRLRVPFAVAVLDRQLVNMDQTYPLLAGILTEYQT
jgi:hypothetical protein